VPVDYIGYKRLSENKRFPNHRWYSDCFIYSTASFLSKLRAKKVEKLRILVIKQLQPGDVIGKGDGISK
jgi:hypothetical protein